MPIVRWFRRAAPALGLALALSGCALDGPRSMFSPIGPVAQEQKDLFMWTFYLSLVVLALVLGVLFYAIVRFRRRPNDDALPNQIHGSVVLEITWTLIPTIIVLLIAVPTVRSIFRTEAHVTPTTEDLVVNVTGYQWWWKFEYPELGIVTANELHVPEGKRVILNLASADVLHSFWAPKLAGKRDLIPNQNNQLWFIANETGPVYGHCAELCLGAHAYMRFRVVVDSEAEFEQWVSAFQQAGEPQANADRLVQADPLVEQGRVLFAQKGCSNCHTIDGYAQGYTIGSPAFPNLTNFGMRHTIAAAVLENTPENLAAWLRDPQAIKPGNYMPALWSPDDPERDEQISALVAYLESLGRQQQPQAEAMGGTHGNR